MVSSYVERDAMSPRYFSYVEKEVLRCLRAYLLMRVLDMTRRD